MATGPEGRYVIAGLPPGVYELRAELASFKPHVRRGLQLTIAQALVAQHHAGSRRPQRRSHGHRRHPLVNTSSAELSYLVGADAIDALPLNGRNYTDLALLQPGVLAYPHRDGGSVVAHGLGMSVNGQDPRSNVYLLDGTLQNDFTNGPAGSAAGTALGTETIREFRVESNAYSAEFGRNSGGQINVLTKSGRQHARRRASTNTIATTRSTPATTSTSASSRTSIATSSAARSADRSPGTAPSSSSATKR